MDLSALKARVTSIEELFESDIAVELCHFDTPHGKLVLSLTERLRHSCRKGKVWKSNAMLTALKNTQYGFDRTRTRSRGGADGVFLLDRTFEPRNEMMRKIFDRFLDKPDPLVAQLSARFAVAAEEFVPVRVVSHHLRLLGVLIEREEAAQLVLVDFDDS